MLVNENRLVPRDARIKRNSCHFYCTRSGGCLKHKTRHCDICIGWVKRVGVGK